MDPDITTLVVDAGFDKPIAVWVKQSIEVVTMKLSKGEWVSGDSSIGEVFVTQSIAKFAQRGKREFNFVAANRPSNLPL